MYYKQWNGEIQAFLRVFARFRFDYLSALSDIYKR
jgi:hypothetical protein